MDIGTLEAGICQIKVCAERRDDLTLELPNGDIVADWPETLTLVSGTTMVLSNTPDAGGEVGITETAWYEL